MGKKKQSINFPLMTDFDSCTFCGSHNGPWNWVTIKGQICFMCEDCYDKYFKHAFDNTINAITKDTRG